MGSQSKKVPLDVYVESLLCESSLPLPESPGLKVEWEHYCKLEGLISKIREKEAGLNNRKSQNGSGDNKDKNSNQTEVERRQASFPPFLKWLEQHDIDGSKVEIYHKNDVEGFGLKVKQPLRTGQVVFTIPQKAILTSFVAKESKIKIMVDKDPLLSGMPNVLLAMFLVYERFVNPNSEWKAYIDTLPHTFDTVVYFSKEEMTVLKNSPTAFREALRMLRNVTRQYAYFHTKFKKATDFASRDLKNIFTYNRYIWGVSAVTTRINHLPDSNSKGDSILSLIPLWDFCNHDESEPVCTDFNDETKTLICYAGHEYEKDTEFTIYYGRRSSIDFLVHNGFVPQTYKNDAYCLELGIGMNDPNYNRKKAILAKLGLECQTTFSVTPEAFPFLKKLFAFIRVFQANEATLEDIEKRPEDTIKDFLEEPTDACWKFLVTRFALLKKAGENSLVATLKSLYGGEGEPKNFPRVTTILLQLLKNEQKLLEMLVHCTEAQQKLGITNTPQPQPLPSTEIITNGVQEMSVEPESKN